PTFTAFHGGHSVDRQRLRGVAILSQHCKGRKKTDVVEHPEVFAHVGLPIKQSPRQSRVTLHLVIRRRQLTYSSERQSFTSAATLWFRAGDSKWLTAERPPGQYAQGLPSHAYT